jgi:hypothetical protein
LIFEIPSSIAGHERLATLWHPQQEQRRMEISSKSVDESLA